MSFTWQSLGSFIPSGSAWLPYTQTQGKGEIIRLTFDMPNRFWGKYNNPVLLSFRYHGGNQLMPCSPPFRIPPDRRGFLLELPFPKWARHIGCNSRIFEIKKSVADSINLYVQLEEMLFNVPPPDDNNTPPDPIAVQLQPGNLIYSWNAEVGYGSKMASIQFPLFTALTKISSNVPVRVRLYPSEARATEDASRPPDVNPENDPDRGIFLDAVLSSNALETQLILSPVPIVVNSNQCALLLEKLTPDAAMINVRFDYVA